MVVHTESNGISLTNVKVSSSKAGDSRERTRKYGFDYCFDSSNPEAQSFADQARIYQTLGQTVLDALFAGYNSCLVAYGQSASGKTYTVMGTKVSYYFFVFKRFHSRRIVAWKFLTLWLLNVLNYVCILWFFCKSLCDIMYAKSQSPQLSVIHKNSPFYNIGQLNYFWDNPRRGTYTRLESKRKRQTIKG